MFDLTSSKESTEEKRNFNVIFSSFLSNFFTKQKHITFLFYARCTFIMCHNAQNL